MVVVKVQCIAMQAKMAMLVYSETLLVGGELMCSVKVLMRLYYITCEKLFVL